MKRLRSALLLLVGLLVVGTAGTVTLAHTINSSNIGGCPLFPADNIWNTDISTLPVHANSANFIASIGLTGHLHADFGAGLYNGAPIGIPYTVVSGSQATVPVTFDYASESDAGPYPIPANAPIEGGAQSTGDRHVIVVNSGSCKLYEMFASYPQSDGSWKAGSGAVWSLRSDALRPQTWTSADAAGLPILAGLARYDEVAAGGINHALRFTVSVSQKSYLWPARHQASSNTDPNEPPMGLRLRLKADVNIASYPPQARIVLTALKHYGMIVADNGSSWFIGGAPDDRWNNDDLAQLRGISGADFEVVDESALQASADSGQALGAESVPTATSTATPTPTATSPTPTTGATMRSTPTSIAIGGIAPLPTATPLAAAEVRKRSDASVQRNSGGGIGMLPLLALAGVGTFLVVGLGIAWRRLSRK